MQTPNDNSLVAACLKKHCLEIVDLWEKRLGEKDSFHIFCKNQNIQMVLGDFFSEIMSIFFNDKMVIPELISEKQSLNLPRCETGVLLTGETAFVEVLKRYLKISKREWLNVRREINETFHEAIRNNSAMACNLCHSSLHKEILEREKLCSQLKHA